MSEENKDMASLGLAIIPLVFMMALLAISISVFGDESFSGPMPISLLMAGGVTAVIGLLRDFRWDQLQKSAVDSISSALGPIMVLLLIGALIGSWLVSGSIQAIIHYSLQFLSAEFFTLPVASFALSWLFVLAPYPPTALRGSSKRASVTIR